MRPLLIQDARKLPEFAAVKAAKVGFTRYLGVPVYDADGQPAGTLCIIDNRCGEPLDEHDERFVSLMGMRISAELAREQHIQGRLSEKDRELVRRQRDLEETNGVLGAMNRAFATLGECETMEDLLREQAHALRGVMGATTAAVLIDVGEGHRGFHAPRGRRKPAAVAWPGAPSGPGGERSTSRMRSPTGRSAWVVDTRASPVCLMSTAEVPWCSWAPTIRLSTTSAMRPICEPWPTRSTSSCRRLNYNEGSWRSGYACAHRVEVNAG